MTDGTERAPSAFRLNLEEQKSRAEDLLRAVKAGEADALSRLAAARGSSATLGSPETTLADAQFVIARELRFASWAKLEAHIESMDWERAAISPAFLHCLSRQLSCFRASSRENACSFSRSPRSAAQSCTASATGIHYDISRDGSAECTLCRALRAGGGTR